MNDADTTRLLVALALLLACVHGGGELATRLRQPRVVGEILGGLVLGPTLLGRVLAGAQSAVFGGAAVTAALGAVYQLGLFLLMFGSGAAVRPRPRTGEMRTVGTVAVVGNLVPFAAGLGMVALTGSDRLVGTAQNRQALALVVACAVAVTSIPVISRIMSDLGIMSTAFARVVLSVAVLEDVALYVVLSIALGLVGSGSGGRLGLPALLSLDPGSVAGALYHVCVSAAFFALPLLGGRALLRHGGGHRRPLLPGGPVVVQLLLLLVLTASALLVGVSAYFGAFIAGLLMGQVRDPGVTAARETIRGFSEAFFVPLYFGLVGMRLDLVRHFDPVFFLVLCAAACAVKAASVYAGARIAGESRRDARTLAAALNARGGPAIVIASVAYDAGIVNQSLFSSLVLLALVTSSIAGTWLDTLRRRGEWAEEVRGIREDEPAPVLPEGVAAALARR